MRCALLLLFLLLSACPAAGPYAAVAVGPGRVCGVLDDGSLRCAGGDTAAWDEEQHTPPASVAFVDISLGTFHGCGRDADGVAHCFGPASTDVVDIPQELRSVSFSRVSAGNAFSCGIRADDATLACWGFDPRGEFTPPAGVFIDVVLGDVANTLCALNELGGASCWGEGASDPPATPFRSLGAGASHACGVEEEGGVSCWGADGDPWTDPPDDVRTTRVVGGINHSCLLDEDGRVSCFGAGPAIDASVPDATFVSLDAGGHQTCGVTEQGAVSCWGLDSETGDGSIASLP